MLAITQTTERSLQQLLILQFMVLRVWIHGAVSIRGPVLWFCESLSYSWSLLQAGVERSLHQKRWVVGKELWEIEKKFKTRSHQQRWSPVRSHQLYPPPPQVSVALASRVTEPSQHITARSGRVAAPSQPTVQCTGPWAQDSMDARVILDARVDSLRVWQDILSARDPHWVPFAQGSGSEMRRLVGGAERPEGVCGNKSRDVWDLAVAKLIRSVPRPLLLPSPWCCSQKCSAKNPLVAVAPQAPAWLTPCHIILWQR